MKIGFFELEGWEESKIKKTLPDDEIIFSKEKISPDNLPEQKDFDVVSVFVGSTLNKEVINSFPNLKFITTRSSGFDHIDLDVCKEKNIGAAYVPGYGDPTVAEFAFGLILSLTRKIYDGVDRIKESGTFSYENLRGIDLKGKTIGIVGLGKIGKAVARMANGFGMKIVAYDPYPDEKFAKETSLSYVSLEDLLRDSDIITLHVPYMKATHHLINNENIKLIKKGAYLINTARGAIVETDALVNALENGTLAGAAMDVLEGEGELKNELTFLTNGEPTSEKLKTTLENHALMRMPNVLVTPHTAFNTKEAVERILSITLDSIKAFKEGKLINQAKKQ